MAAPTIVYIDTWQDDCHIVTWTLTNADGTGTAFDSPGSNDRSVQIEGTFGAATIVIEGSNDGTNYQLLTDPQGNDISKTTADLEQITEITRWIRPRLTGGAGSTVTVTLLVRRPAR